MSTILAVDYCLFAGRQHLLHPPTNYIHTYSMILVPDHARFPILPSHSPAISWPLGAHLTARNHLLCVTNRSVNLTSTAVLCCRSEPPKPTVWLFRWASCRASLRCLSSCPAVTSRLANGFTMTTSTEDSNGVCKANRPRGSEVLQRWPYIRMYHLHVVKCFSFSEA